MPDHKSLRATTATEVGKGMFGKGIKKTSKLSERRCDGQRNRTVSRDGLQRDQVKLDGGFDQMRLLDA
ncbi:MAG: hypothetical protein JNK57_19820 [Planctomycetaceae bacterium]|nr:hypothetical protein [Planctomycetaceae bacterium]